MGNLLDCAAYTDVPNIVTADKDGIIPLTSTGQDATPEAVVVVEADRIRHSAGDAPATRGGPHDDVDAPVVASFALSESQTQVLQEMRSARSKAQQRVNQRASVCDRPAHSERDLHNRTTVSSVNPFLQEPCPLPHSILWELQREWYVQRNINNNTRSVNTPIAGSSSAFIGHAYARMIVDYVRDLNRAGELDLREPLYVVELGSGSGKLGFHIATRLLELAEFLPRLSSSAPCCASGRGVDSERAVTLSSDEMRSDSRSERCCEAAEQVPARSERGGRNSRAGQLCVRVVMSDLCESLVDSWLSNPPLRALMEQGIMDVAVIDAESDTSFPHELKLRYSLRTIAGPTVNPVVCISSCVFSSLRQDSFQIRKGKLFRGTVSLSASCAHWNEVVQGADKVANESGKVGSTRESRDTHGVQQGDRSVTNAEDTNSEDNVHVPPQTEHALHTWRRRGNHVSTNSNVNTSSRVSPRARSSTVPADTVREAGMPARQNHSDSIQRQRQVLQSPGAADASKFTCAWDFLPVELHEGVKDAPTSHSETFQTFDLRGDTCDEPKTECSPEKKTRRQIRPSSRSLEVDSPPQPNSSASDNDWNVDSEPQINDQDKEGGVEATTRATSDVDGVVLYLLNELSTHPELRDAASVLVPTGAFMALTRVASFCGGRMLLLTGDKGHNCESDMVGLRTPRLNVQGGFSFPVNFPLLKRFAQVMYGARVVQTKFSEGFQCSATYLYLTDVAQKQRARLRDLNFSSRHRTPQATFESNHENKNNNNNNSNSTFVVPFPDDDPMAELLRQRIAGTFKRSMVSFQGLCDSFGPEQFATFQRCMKDEAKFPSLRQILALLRLGRGDQDLFFKFRHAMIDRIATPYCSAPVQRDAKLDVTQVLRHYYPLHRSRDVSFELGRLHMALKEYDLAIAYFDMSIIQCGEHYVTQHNIGICYFCLKQIHNAKNAFERSLLLNSSYAEARTWLDKVEAAAIGHHFTRHDMVR